MSYDPDQVEFNSDGEAVQFLESRGYLCAHGAIIPKSLGHPIPAEEAKAVNYLIREWDWTYLEQ